VFQVIAGPLVLLVWLYLLAFGVILGAELNAELERMWPSPEQRQAPRGQRLRQRLLDTPAGAAAAARIEERLPDIVQRARNGSDDA
jgi:membrane protein